MVSDLTKEEASGVMPWAACAQPFSGPYGREVRWKFVGIRRHRLAAGLRRRHAAAARLRGQGFVWLERGLGAWAQA